MVNGSPLVDRKASLNITEEINKTGIWSSLNTNDGRGGDAFKRNGGKS